MPPKQKTEFQLEQNWNQKELKKSPTFQLIKRKNIFVERVGEKKEKKKSASFMTIIEPTDTPDALIQESIVTDEEINDEEVFVVTKLKTSEFYRIILINFDFANLNYSSSYDLQEFRFVVILNFTNDYLKFITLATLKFNL